MLSSDRHERFSPHPSSSSLVDIGKAKVYRNPCNANNCFGPFFDGNNDAKAYIDWEIALIEQFTCFHVLDSRKSKLLVVNFVLMHYLGGVSWLEKKNTTHLD